MDMKAKILGGLRSRPSATKKKSNDWAKVGQELIDFCP
jgi:hypothetical protein